MNYNEEGRNERERRDGGRSGRHPEAERSHPCLEVSTRTVSEWRALETDDVNIHCQEEIEFKLATLVSRLSFNIDLESEIRDRFESEGFTETRVTPRARRRHRHVLWRSYSRDSCEEMNSSVSAHDTDPGSASGSNKSSRRSSIVSMIQRRMSRGERCVMNVSWMCHECVMIQMDGLISLHDWILNILKY